MYCLLGTLSSCVSLAHLCVIRIRSIRFELSPLIPSLYGYRFTWYAVLGSGHDPGTDESKSTKHLYDGTIEHWDVFKMHNKSNLHQKGLWRVVKEGPQQA